MPQHNDHDIIIVSDLHLSVGFDTGTGLFSDNEQFFFDDAFARFLDNLCSRAAKENRKWRLVILGDLFDFTHVEIESWGRCREDTSEEIVLSKLEQIAEGHPEFFAALGRWLNEGFTLDIVPGNHDIELMRQSAQEHLRGVIVKFSGRAQAGAGISFHPWIYYVPGVVYAEHGHQYHDINWFPTLLRPYLFEDANTMYRPLGSYFDEYLINLIKSIDSSAGVASPPSRYLIPAFRTHPAMLLDTSRHHVRFVKVLLRHLSNLSSSYLIAKRESYHGEMLRAYSTKVGLSYQTLVNIDGLAAKSAMSIKRRLLRKWILAPVLRSLRRMVAVLMVYAALSRRRSTASSLLVCVVGVLSLPRRKQRSMQLTTRSSDYLRQIPMIIHRLLQVENKSVPYYVFGHTHIAEQFPLAFTAGAPYYINSGTWTHMTGGKFELLGNREFFTFVQITHNPETGTPIGRLLLWNDAAARQEPLPLLKM